MNVISIKTILEKTREKMKEDNTIICHDKHDILVDCNGYVCPESIALRELMIYGEFDEALKSKIFSLLMFYSQSLENDYDNFYDALKIVNDVENSEIDWVESSKILLQVLCFNQSYILEIAIKQILLERWKDYEIPTERYDEIVYSHKTPFVSTYERLMYHYKCLHDKSLDWDDIGEGYKYDIELTYKDLKIISLNARDSGGHMDCFGYAHDGTTMNCIHAFISNKYNIPLGEYYDFEDEELEDVCQEIFDYCLLLGEFYITMY